MSFQVISKSKKQIIKNDLKKLQDVSLLNDNLFAVEKIKNIAKELEIDLLICEYNDLKGYLNFEIELI